MNNKLSFRAILIIGLLALGMLVFSQSNNSKDFLSELSSRTSGLSTQAINTCSGTWCDRVTVNQIIVNKNGSTYISTSGIETDLSCTPESGNFIKTNESVNPNFKEMYTILLAAKLSNSSITIAAVSGSDGFCYLEAAVLGDA